MLPVGGDDPDLDDVVRQRPERAGGEADPAAEREPADADGGHEPFGIARSEAASAASTSMSLAPAPTVAMFDALSSFTAGETAKVDDHAAARRVAGIAVAA